jgi:selenocysteine-specific elongation factor
MKVIGTAGHVDHGKSTLIAALTGTHPDRLKEEREREMTIDLGFGWLTLPGGEEIGIVDVPGHRDFIENMLAGVGGLDAALLIVAADEGVMPQTREHLAILDLLQIPAAMVVITKVDLIRDDEWLNLIEGDIRAAMAGTVLEDAPAVRVSARTGFGLDDLLSGLSQILQNVPSRADLGRPRLPVDRVFSMPGFGTVVTGTLTDGHLRVGEEVVILPSGKTGRVRGLQTHKKNEERALPGSRTAVNISGLSVEDIRRGEVVATPGQYLPTQRLDARLRLLKDTSPLRHAAQVKFFSGASETIGSLRLLEGGTTPVVQPGDEAWVQIELRDPVVVARGDHFILRRPSPAETLGGGLIVDPQPGSRHRRREAGLSARLDSLLQGSPADIFLQAAQMLGAAPLKDITARSRLQPDAAASALQELLPAGSLILLEEGPPLPTADLLAVPAAQWAALATQTEQTLEAYHRQHPLRRGMPREELKSRLKLPARVFTALVKRLCGSLPPLGMMGGREAENRLVESGGWIALSTHQIQFTPAQEARMDALRAKFAATPYSPPSVKESQAEAGEDVYAALVELGELVPVSAEVVFRKTDYDLMVERVRGYIRREGQITAAETRDLFNTSRKYALALLEHLDATGVTVREGDFRKLRV